MSRPAKLGMARLGKATPVSLLGKGAIRGRPSSVQHPVKARSFKLRSILSTKLLNKAVFHNCDRIEVEQQQSESHTRSKSSTN